MRLIRYVAALFLAFAAGGSPASGGLDGHGWERASVDLRSGFVAGYMDCAVNDDGETRYVGVGPESLTSAIDSQFKSRPGSMSRRVADVLRELLPRVTKSGRPATPQGGAQVHSGRHGFFTGEYWRKATANHREGFLAGYLECWSASGSRDVEFPRALAWYSERITAWYGITADGGDLRLDRASTGIADVLRVVGAGPSPGLPGARP